MPFCDIHPGRVVHVKYPSGISNQSGTSIWDKSIGLGYPYPHPPVHPCEILHASEMFLWAFFSANTPGRAMSTRLPRCTPYRPTSSRWYLLSILLDRLGTFAPQVEISIWDIPRLEGSLHYRKIIIMDMGIHLGHSSGISGRWCVTTVDMDGQIGYPWWI